MRFAHTMDYGLKAPWLTSILQCAHTSLTPSDYVMVSKVSPVPLGLQPWHMDAGLPHLFTFQRTAYSSIGPASLLTVACINLTLGCFWPNRGSLAGGWHRLEQGAWDNSQILKERRGYQVIPRERHRTCVFGHMSIFVDVHKWARSSLVVIWRWGGFGPCCPKLVYLENWELRTFFST